MALSGAQMMDTAFAVPVQDPPQDAVEWRIRARTALRLADLLLNQLELLALKGRRDVPDSVLALVSRTQAAATAAGVRRPALDPHACALRLMDLVYDLEGNLLPQCRVRPYPPPPSTQ